MNRWQVKSLLLGAASALLVFSCSGVEQDALPFSEEMPGKARVLTFELSADSLSEGLNTLELEVRDGQSRGWTEDEVVAGISMKGAPDLEPVPFGANREKTTRLMDRALRPRKE